MCLLDCVKNVNVQVISSGNFGLDNDVVDIVICCTGRHPVETDAHIEYQVVVIIYTFVAVVNTSEKSEKNRECLEMGYSLVKHLGL
jgi:hypothetical protein